MRSIIFEISWPFIMASSLRGKEFLRKKWQYLSSSGNASGNAFWNSRLRIACSSFLKIVIMRQAQNSHQSDFILRTYHFRELALLYFPTNTPASASQAFRRMIRGYNGLLAQLQEKGFAPGGRVMTPAVVETLVRHLGEP